MLMCCAVVLTALIVTPGCGSQSAGTGAVVRTSGRLGDVWWQQMPDLSPVDLADGERLNVVATTSIVADVVRNVAGEHVVLTTLVPLNVDPHAFQPTPREVAAVASADVVFANGAGLEEFLGDLLQAAGEGGPVVPVSHGIELLRLDDPDHADEDGEDHGGLDPHTWFDPQNVIVWTEVIESALTALNPAHADDYAANAEVYREQVRALDAWIRDQTALVPQDSRRLVADHAVLGYFAARYGYEQAAALLPGFSTLAEPSAAEMAALEDAIRQWDVQAIFVGRTANPSLAERVSADTGVALVFLYTGSLDVPGSAAGDYLSFMRTNVTAIVEALR